MGFSSNRNKVGVNMKVFGAFIIGMLGACAGMLLENLGVKEPLAYWWIGFATASLIGLL